MNNLFIFNSERSRSYKIKPVQIGLFLILFLASIIGFEALNRYFIVSKSKHFVTLNDFDRKKDEVKILFLGDSHFKRGLEPKKLPQDAYNLSFVNSSYISSYYILKHFIDQMPKLKTVVLPVDYHSFSSYRIKDTVNSIFWDQYIDYQELTSIAHHPIKKNRFKLTIANEEFGRFNFIVNVKEFLFRLFGKSNVSFSQLLDTQLSGESPTEAVETEKKAAEKVNQQLRGQNLLDETVLTYFEKILKLCREKRIRVITVEMPLSDDYVKHAESLIKKETIRKKVLNDPVYGSLIYKNLNYIQLYSHRNNYFSWAWRDGDHLNSRGREKFTELLIPEIIKLSQK